MDTIMGTPVFKVNRFSGIKLSHNTGMSIGNRVKQARKDAKMTQGELAAKAGLKQSTISDLELGKSQGSTSVASIATALGVSPLWLESGRGPMRPTEVDPAEGLNPGTFMRVRVVDEDDPSLVKIPKVKLRLSAGISGFEIESEPYDGTTTTVPTDWMQRRGFNRDQLLAIRVRGESMEPTFYEDDLVVINTADIRPVDGGVYAINYEGEPVVKRMERDAGDWWLRSDNPDQRKFSRKICRGDACIIIGKVVRKESERF